MVLSVSAVVLLGLVVVLLIRSQTLRSGRALAAAGSSFLFGCLLSITDLTRSIHHGLAAITNLVNQITT
ncbi:hypothetical protein OG754_40270 (plasmid) [Streptomyces decoyicus]|uniref:hypothetical protein n=1 Tax=Streptomyces decoyicus TaxID=249567 RepID=UPI002E313714|nr:hypothetical protein [Streptomyces decoyicus]